MAACRSMSEQVSLEVLYRLVPWTQEEDLLEELAHERDRPHEDLVGCERYWPRGPHSLQPLPSPYEPVLPEDPFDDPTPAQALGLVLHLLGGSVLRDA